MKLMNIHKTVALAALAVLAACTSDDVESTGEDGGVTGDNVSQKIEFLIGGNPVQDILTRDVPPGVDGGLIGADTAKCNVDRIRLLVFKRAEGSEGSFLYDVANSTDDDGQPKVLEATAAEITGEDGVTVKNGRQASCVITKEKGYEYKAIAVGYNSKRKLVYPHSDKFPVSLYDGQSGNVVDESRLFKIVKRVALAADASNPISEADATLDEDTPFEDVCLQVVPFSLADKAGAIAGKAGNDENSKILLTGWCQFVPEIYYGTCRSVGGTDIIKFSDENTITGYLYRGVARLTVDVKNIAETAGIINHLSQNQICTMALVGDSIRQAVHLSDYEEFRTPFFNFERSGDLNGFGAKADADGAQGHTAILTDGYLSEDNVKDNVCHHYNNDLVTFEGFLLPTQTRLYLRTWEAYHTKLFNTQTSNRVYERSIVVKNLSNGSLATGIIDPIAGGEFVYFRRNQAYKLTIDGDILKDVDRVKF